MKDGKTMADGKEFTVSWPSWVQELLQAFASVKNVHIPCVGDEMTAKSCDHGGIHLQSLCFTTCVLL